MSDLPQIQEGLVVHVGDTVIVRVDPGATDQEVDDLTASLAAAAPGLRWVVVAAEQIAVERGRPNA